MQIRIKGANGVTAIDVGQSPVTGDGQQPTGAPGVSAMQILAGWGHGATAGLGGADWTSGCGVFRGEAYRMGPSFNQQAKEANACAAAGVSRICSPFAPFGVWLFPQRFLLEPEATGRMNLTLPVAGRLFAYEMCVTRVENPDTSDPIVESMFLASITSAGGPTFRMVWPADAPAAVLTAANVVSNAAVAGADLTVTLSINGVAVTGGVVTVAVGAAGATGTATPTAQNTIAPGQTLLATIGGGNTTAGATGSLNLTFIPLESTGCSESCQGCGDCGGDCELVRVGDWKSRQITTTYPGLGRDTGFTPSGGTFTPYDPNRETVTACYFSKRRLLDGQNFLPPWVPNVELENGNDELSWALSNSSTTHSVVLQTIMHIKYGKFDLAKAAELFCAEQAACEC